MKVKLLNTEFEADGTTGRIQVGEKPGPIAQVTVPAFWVPVASAGTVPSPPGTDTAPPWVLVDPPPLLLLLLLLQAASAVMLATARTSPPILLLRIFIIGPPSSRCSRFWSVLGSSGCRPSLLCFAGDPLRTVAGRWVAGPLTAYGPFPGTSVPAHAEPAGELPVL